MVAADGGLKFLAYQTGISVKLTRECKCKTTLVPDVRSSF